MRKKLMLLLIFLFLGGLLPGCGCGSERVTLTWALFNMKGDQQVEEIEASIVKIYEYAKAHKIDLDMDASAYLAGELDAMAKKKAPVSIKVTITRRKAPEANAEVNPRSRYTRHVEMRKARQRIRQTVMQENAG